MYETRHTKNYPGKSVASPTKFTIYFKTNGNKKQVQGLAEMFDPAFSPAGDENQPVEKLFS